MHLCLTVECITSGLHFVCFFIRSPPPPPRRGGVPSQMCLTSCGSVPRRAKGSVPQGGGGGRWRADGLALRCPSEGPRHRPCTECNPIARPAVCLGDALPPGPMDLPLVSGFISNALLGIKVLRMMGPQVPCQWRSRWAEGSMLRLVAPFSAAVAQSHALTIPCAPFPPHKTGLKVLKCTPSQSAWQRARGRSALL